MWPGIEPNAGVSEKSKMSLVLVNFIVLRKPRCPTGSYIWPDLSPDEAEYKYFEKSSAVYRYKEVFFSYTECG